MGRSQVLYNKSKAKSRKGRDNSSILSELTGASSSDAASSQPQQRYVRPHPTRVPSYASEADNNWRNNVNTLSYTESEPSVSVGESQQVVDHAVDRMLLEMPSATSAYAQSYAHRSSSSHRHHSHTYLHQLKVNTSASVVSLDDNYVNAPSVLTSSNSLQFDVMDACLEQGVTLAERYNIPQHLMDAIYPPAQEHGDSSICSPELDEALSLKSMFNERLHQAMTGDERIMAARSPSSSPTRQRMPLDTIVSSPHNNHNHDNDTPRSLHMAPSDENSILAEATTTILSRLSCSSDEHDDDDLVMASRQSSDDEDETMQLLGSLSTKQRQPPSVTSTNGTSTLAGEQILDEQPPSISRRSPQPMPQTNNETMQVYEGTVPKSTTAIEGVLKLHRKSLSPPRDARINNAAAKQSPKPVPASPSRERPAASTKQAAPSPALSRLRTPLRIDTDQRTLSPSHHHQHQPPMPQFTSEEMTTISSVGLQSIRDNDRLHPPPLSSDSGWAPKPGESFEIKTVGSSARPRSPRNSALKATAAAKTPVAAAVSSSKSMPVASNKNLATPSSANVKSPPTPTTMTPKQQGLHNKIRSVSPSSKQQAPASTPPATSKKDHLPSRNTTRAERDDKRVSASPTRAATPTRAQLYPIHDVSVKVPKSGSNHSQARETSALPQNERDLLESVGLGGSLAQQRRGRSPVRRNEPTRSTPPTNRPPTSISATTTSQPLSLPQANHRSGAAPLDDGGGGGNNSLTDNNSAQTSAILSSIHLLEDCDTVPGIEVSERKARALQKSSNRGGAGSFSYQGDVDLHPIKSDVATYVEDESNQGLEIKRKHSDQQRRSSGNNNNKTPSPLRVRITTKEVAKYPHGKTGRTSSSSPQRHMVDVIDLSAVDSASLSPSRIIRAIRTGQPLLRDTTSASPSRRLPNNRDAAATTNHDSIRRSISSERRRRQSSSPRRTTDRDEWLNAALKSGSGQEEGIEVEDVGELNDWLDSVIA
ncbi:hypothetical protein MPSEU_000196900 [Mayamaea pseudoterrestris]|nr:hypothetical protein MPSEU_000196900 [Mayamaea pseudoterrestris]